MLTTKTFKCKEKEAKWIRWQNR